MASKRLASTAPTPLRRSKRVVQQPVEEPSSSPTNENAEDVEYAESQQEDGDYKEEELSEEMSEEMDIEDTDVIMQNGVGDELLLEAVEDEMEAPEDEEPDLGTTNEEDQSRELTRQVLQQMNLPSDIFESPDVDWLDKLLEVSEASAEMKEAIRRFAVRYVNTIYQVHV